MIALEPFDGGDPVEMKIEGRGSGAVLRLWVDADGATLLHRIADEVIRQTRGDGDYALFVLLLRDVE